MNIEAIRSHIRDQLKKNKDERIKESKARSLQKASKYYGSKYWKDLRNRYIGAHPLCENCLQYNIITPAENVHHLIPFYRGTTEKERWELLLDEHNLKSLCKDCHKTIHQLLQDDPNATSCVPLKLRLKLYDDI